MTNTSKTMLCLIVISAVLLRASADGNNTDPNSTPVVGAANANNDTSTTIYNTTIDPVVVTKPATEDPTKVYSTAQDSTNGDITGDPITMINPTKVSTVNDSLDNTGSTENPTTMVTQMSTAANCTVDNCTVTVIPKELSSLAKSTERTIMTSALATDSSSIQSVTDASSNNPSIPTSNDDVSTNPTSVTDATVSTVDAPHHKLSKSGAVALGICIPIIIIALSCVIYCNRKRLGRCKGAGRSRHYANLSEDGMSFGGLQNPSYDIDL